jgi:rhodanese-related sulfurtransferase
MKTKWVGVVLAAVLIAGALAGCAANTTTATSPATTTTAAATETTTTTTAAIPADSFIEVTPAEALELMGTVDDLIVIDVSPHYMENHLPGAISFYLGADELAPAIPRLDKGHPYLVYCHATSVATSGAQMLVDAGFSTVYLLQGNYAAWVGAGYEVRTPDRYLDVNAATADALIRTKDDLVVVDVSPYYDNGHLPGAVHLYLGDGSLEAAVPTLDTDVPYLVYCHADTPAITGAQKLIDAGFMPVYRLIGNYPGWAADGYPVEQ